MLQEFVMGNSEQCFGSAAVDHGTSHADTVPKGTPFHVWKLKQPE